MLSAIYFLNKLRKVKLSTLIKAIPGAQGAMDSVLSKEVVRALPRARGLLTCTCAVQCSQGPVPEGADHRNAAADSLGRFGFSILLDARLLTPLCRVCLQACRARRSWSRCVRTRSSTLTATAACKFVLEFLGPGLAQSRCTRAMCDGRFAYVYETEFKQHSQLIQDAFNMFMHEASPSASIQSTF